MARKIAAASALLVFAFCLIVGIAADNTFATTLSRALAAMIGTFFIGLIVGVMAQKMMDEHLASQLKAQAPTGPAGEQANKIEGAGEGKTDNRK